MLRALAEVILPVVLVAGLGGLLGRKFAIEQGSLNKVQLYGLVPVLAFSSLMKLTAPMADVIVLGIGYLLTSLVIGLVAWVFARPFPGKTRGAMVACVVVGNNGNFGLPIAMLALGQAGLDQAVILFLFSIVVMWTVGPALLGSQGGLRTSIKAILRLPVLWAMAAAVVLRVLGWTPPVGIMSAVELVAAACVPMVLLSLGIQLSQSKKILFSAPMLIAAGLRVVALPLVAWGIGKVIGLAGLPLQSLVLACAMPTAVNISMLAFEFDAESDMVAAEVALSTVLSIATIAVVVTFLPVFA